MEKKKKTEVKLKIEKDAAINRMKLDEELERQPELFLLYASALAEAKDERDRIKEHLDYTKAKTALAYREKPPDGIKVTEAVISSLVDTDANVHDASVELFDAQRNVNSLEADVEALQHRRSSLKNLTQLWIGGYYAVPGTTREDDVSANVRGNLKSRQRSLFEDEDDDE